MVTYVGRILESLKGLLGDGNGAIRMAGSDLYIPS